jgi:PTS system mannose-specific IIA component
MVAFLLVTHGEIGKSLSESAYLVFNKKQKKIEYVSVNPSDEIQEIKKIINQKIKLIDKKNGLIIFTDIIGATPSNILKDFSNKINLKIISGVNLAMLITAITSKENDLNKIASECQESAIENIIEVDFSD